MKTKPNVKVKLENLEREALVALERVEKVSLSLRAIEKVLKQIHEIILANISFNHDITLIDANLIINTNKSTSGSTEVEEDKDKPIFIKKRNKLENSPERLWFKMHGIHYYIEFSIRCNKNSERLLEGCLIYGMSYYIEKGKVEDKPILSFFIDNNGIIKSNDDFEDESWTIKKEHIVDLHLRAIDKIWEEGLFNINKDKFQ